MHKVNIEDMHPDDVVNYEEAVQDDSEPEETPHGLNMHCILENIWIGDYQASQQFDVLRELGIKHLIAAMRGSYNPPEDFHLHHVDIEDTDRTNILEHLDECNTHITQAVQSGEGVLIHCQAGISRSATICAAFLMQHYKLTSEEAIDKITAVRSQCDPIEFFMLQLEMYERMNYEVDPNKSQEYRRFLYNFNHSEVMDGDGTIDNLHLAYFPSPAINPRRRRSSSVSSIGSALGMTPSRRGSTSGKAPAKPSFANLSMTSSAAPEGQASEGVQRSKSLSLEKDEKRQREEAKSQPPPPQGKRLRCKMCRRELAAKEHVVKHEPGEGQDAFAPRRRDMAQFRLDQAKKHEEAQKQQRGPSHHASVSMNAGGSGKSPMDNPNHPLNALARRKAQLDNQRAQSETSSSAIETSQNDNTVGTAKAHEAIPAPPRASSPLLASPACTSYFVEPLSWMGPVLETGAIGGKLTCPSQRCGGKLGSFDWAGQQCSCGAWIVPAFVLNASKVDEI